MLSQHGGTQLHATHSALPNFRSLSQSINPGPWKEITGLEIEVQIQWTFQLCKNDGVMLMENLDLGRPQVHHAQDPLQFGNQEKVGVEYAILYLLHRAYSHLDKASGAVRMTFFDFSSVFDTIRPLLREKLTEMRVDPRLVTWITDYLTERPQYVRLKGHTSDTVVSSIGAPQGTVLSPVLFTLYTSDFQYNTGLCHIQKYSDDTVIVSCIKDGQEEEYRSLVVDFVRWCRTNRLQTKDMVVDFRRKKPHLQPLSVEASVLFYAVVCWGRSSKKRDAGRLDRLVRRAGSVVGSELDSLVTVAERRTLDKLLSTLDNAHHPLHNTFIGQRSVQWQTAVPARLHQQTYKLFRPPHQTVQQLPVMVGRTIDKRTISTSISTPFCTVYCFCTVLLCYKLFSF
ncbi:uncharacterized protein LOC123984521 isoform X2 [Micropterus dolomieu]|uniref:uncharacterized protein LOC123984521 isoform X2 n=1 Tax=Micropterus dolomieu TaxID=147949 RepID=UPI001E8D2785|nr:uncharacterized protein LOC123984521 isoform X2 [Micropterus dolomieu]